MADEADHISLDEALVIKGPHELKDAPNAYSFGRKRELTEDPLFWKKILDACGIDSKEVDLRRRLNFRSYFETHWGITAAKPLSQAIIDENVFDLSADWGAYIHRPSSVYTTTRQKDVDGKFYIFDAPASSYRVAPYATDPEFIKDGCVLRVPLGNDQYRWFQPLIEDGNNAPKLASKNDFREENWPLVWTQIAELVHLFFEIDPGKNASNPSRDDVQKRVSALACRGFSGVDIVRADAALIDQQYQYAENDRLLALQLAERAKKLLTDAIPNALISAIPTLTFQYRELNSYLPKVELLRRRLSDAASDIGYKLFLEKTPVKYWNAAGEEKETTFDPGILFKEGVKTVSWVTYQTVTETSRSWFRKRTRTYQVPIEHRKSFTFYERAAIKYDPWTDVADAYRRQGYNVYLFRETAQGLKTPDAASINEIMHQCRTNESFRLQCVIGVPFYEYSIIGERLLVGYVLLVRPLPEISPASFPTISVDERLTYKFAWQGVSLGELAATIPLSPGEERTVTVAVSQKYETSRTVTTSSLNEVTRVDKSDFETVFEKEVRQDKESTTSGGGSIGGSYGGFSGSANFSKSTTTKDMSRQLNRSVQRAAQELTRRAKEETTISVSEKTETSTSTTTSYKLKNINEGRTLNINFYRIMNNFSSNLYLDDFDFHVEAGRELVMGTELREGRTISRTNLSELWDYLLSPEVMPIDVSDKSEKFRTEICKALAESMTKEYGDEKKLRLDGDHAERLKSILSDRDVSPDKLAEIGGPFPVLFVPTFTERYLDLKERSSAEKDEAFRFLSLTFSTENCDFQHFLNKPFKRADFSYDSGGLHADAQVGLRPATEDYSERMRNLEEKEKEANQRLVTARANYLNSRSAKNLISLEQVIDKTKVYVTQRMGLYEVDGHVSLKLRLSNDLMPSEGWAVIIKGGGGYLQNSMPTLGVLEFRLPRPYGDGAGNWDIANKPHEWFVQNVWVWHEGLRLKLNYKTPVN